MLYSLLFATARRTTWYCDSMLQSLLFIAAYHACSSLFVTTCHTIFYLLLQALQLATCCSMLQSLLFVAAYWAVHYMCDSLLFVATYYTVCYFIAACHAVCCIFYSSLFVAACCTVSYLSPRAVQLVVYHCTVQHNLGKIGCSKLLDNCQYEQP